MASITAAQIKAIAGANAKPALVSAIVNGWPTAVQKAKLNTRNRAAHFLAQIMTETGGLQVLTESGAYNASRISQIFGVGRHSAKVTPAEAAQIAALPVVQRGPVLFDRVYGPGNPTKAKEFNNRNPGDGWKYRGGGMMQATGKNNYAAMEKKTGLPLVAHPELLHNPDSAFMAAYLEWAQDGRCNAAADRDDVVAVRKIINGGSNGLSECKAFLAKAKKALVNYGAAPVASFVSEPEIEEVDDEPTELNIQPETGTQSIDVEIIQKKLIKLGYYEVGIPNGILEGRTKAAIAAFKNDRGLDGPPVVDDELKSAIQENLDAGWSRPIAEVRANATANDLAPTVPAVRLTLWQRLGAKITAWGAGVGAMFSGASSYFQTFSDYIQPIKDFFIDVPGWFWFLLIAAAAVIWWISTNKAVDATVKDFNEGRRL